MYQSAIPYRSRAIRSVAGALCSMVFLSACGDSEEVARTADTDALEEGMGRTGVSALTAGITKDSLIRILGEGPIAKRSADDTIQVFHGYRAQLIVLPDAFLHLIWYRKSAVPFDALPDRSEDTPIILQGATVVVAGWEGFDQYRKAKNLPVTVPDLATTTPENFGRRP